MGRFVKFGWIWAALPALVLCLSSQLAMADDQGSKGDNQQKNDSKQQKSDNNEQKEAQFDVQNHITGTISELKKKAVEGADRMQCVLTTDDGVAVTVDLGKPDETKDLGLKEKDKVTASGPLARFAGQEILLADKVKQDKKTATIERRMSAISGKLTDLQFAALALTAPRRMA